MIIQPPGPREDGRSLVIEQLEHSRFAGRLGLVWGNEEFSLLEPRDLMQELVIHHDDGWDIVDAELGRDPDSGLPYNLVKTPLPDIVRSSKLGPEKSERMHPFIGLVSSMHTYGLYTGRYGMSDKIFVDMIAAEHRPAVDDLLASELARQARLKQQLAADPASAAWAGEEHLFHNYKRLQFFDTLALYFHCTPEAQRGDSEFPNVPRQVGDDVTISVRRVATGRYTLDPFPFCRSGVAISYSGRRLGPIPGDTNVRDALAAAPQETETVVLEAA